MTAEEKKKYAEKLAKKAAKAAENAAMAEVEQATAKLSKKQATAKMSKKHAAAATQTAKPLAIAATAKVGVSLDAQNSNIFSREFNVKALYSFVSGKAVTGKATPYKNALWNIQKSQYVQLALDLWKEEHPDLLVSKEHISNWTGHHLNSPDDVLPQMD